MISFRNIVKIIQITWWKYVFIRDSVDKKITNGQMTNWNDYSWNFIPFDVTSLLSCYYTIDIQSFQNSSRSYFSISLDIIRTGRVFYTHDM